jgi:TetR/AcrR family transcriptional regulator, cholesterol catabolism regulator
MRGHVAHPVRDPDTKMQLVLRHAARVFAENGFEGSSMRDISRASRVSLSGLYYYFESKQEILYQIQAHAFSNLLRLLEDRLARIPDPVERLRELIRNHICYFLSHPWETKVLAHEEDALDEPFRRKVMDLKRHYYKVSQGIFRELSGNPREDRRKERVALLSLFGMMNWIYKWYNARMDPPADELADMIFAIFLRGVAPPANRSSGISRHVRNQVAAMARAGD